MKSSDEMVRDLFELREKYTALQKKKRKTAVKISSTVVLACLICTVGAVMWRTGLFRTLQNKTNDVSPKQNSVTRSKNDIYIEEEGLTQWYGKTVTSGLFNSLENADDSKALQIFARPLVDYEYEFKGKTLAKYYSDMCDERNLPELLYQLLKEGDSLKYGEALYTTGTPTGERWVKELYDERIKFYGNEILEKYIADGEFLKDKVEEDIEISKNKNVAETAYNKALSDYLQWLANSFDGSFSAEVSEEKRGITFFLTKSEFARFTIDSIEGWTFDLAIKDYGFTENQYGDDE